MDDIERLGKRSRRAKKRIAARAGQATDSK
jgi:hypothetical protein